MCFARRAYGLLVPAQALDLTVSRGGQTFHATPLLYFNQRMGATILLPQVQAAIADGTLAPCLVVLINGMLQSYYCDTSDGRFPVESVIIKDLIPSGSEVV